MLGYTLLGLGGGLGLGFTGSAWATRAGRVFRRIFRAVRPPPSGFVAVHADAIEWRGNQSHRDRTNFFMRPLPGDDERGHALMLVRYPAGQLNPSHVHPVGHGMYVLRGELVTHRGSFGPDTFVWFPANEVMVHGAGPAEDLVVLFSASAGLDTRYVASASG